MNVTVYLGSGFGNDGKYEKAARELGRVLGEGGNTLVYGGSGSGLMGVLADAVLSAGGKVIGVEPQKFMDAGFAKEGLTELIVTKDMWDRKATMMRLGDAFIAFPGGTGTLEEIADAMSAVSLKDTKGPCILYNMDGYYDSLKALLETMKREGFSSEARQQNIFFAGDLDEIIKIIREAHLTECSFCRDHSPEK